MHSLSARLLLAASLTLTAFLGLTGYALDRAFQQSAEAAVRDRLLGYIWGLIAATEFDAEGHLRLRAYLMPDPRFNQAESGLYGVLRLPAGNLRWSTTSAEGIQLPDIPARDMLETEFKRVTDARGREMYLYTYGVTQDQTDIDLVYTYAVVESLEGYNAQVNSFRNRLFSWLGGVALLLLLVLYLILRWGLAPLRRAAQELTEIERGRQNELTGRYPRELEAFTNKLNGFIHSNRLRLERYRHSLADLAHSLKTPLALIRGAAAVTDDDRQLRTTVTEQVDRMNNIVEYQLHRAATSGRTPLVKPLNLHRLATKISASLAKVYHDKGVDARVQIPHGLIFNADEDDFTELLGNLMDNAYKWCLQSVVVRASYVQGRQDRGVLCLRVEDDGPGVEPELAEQIVERGVYSNQPGGGTGIGLAMVKDIVDAYDGKLTFSRSSLGGERVEVCFQQ